MILAIDFLCIFVLVLFCIYQGSVNKKMRQELKEQKRINKELSVKLLRKQMIEDE